MTYHETPSALSKRKKAGWIFTILGALVLFFGCSTTNDPYFGSTFKLMGIGTGGFMLVMGLHGLISNPELSVNEYRIEVKGWMLPMSNYDLEWSNIAKAQLNSTIPNARMLFLWDKTGKLRQIEEQRFDGFNSTMEFVVKKLQEKGMEVEPFVPLVPGAKSN